MRKSIFATFTAAVAVAAALLLTGCERAIDMAGRPVSFDAGISDGASGPKTRVAYGEISGEEGSKKQPLEWKVNDLITIYCAQCESKKSAGYKVTEVESLKANLDSYASIVNAESDGIGLQWGTGSHTFYAVYPKADGTGTTINGKDITGVIPATQGFTEVSGTNDAKIVAPDMKNMYMVSKAGTYEPDASPVTLVFQPLSTALEFTITNKFEDTESAMIVKSISLVSTGHALSGGFAVDMDQNGSYGRPKTTLASGTTAADNNTVTIDFDDAPVTVAYDKTLNFTFFLNPGNEDDVNDLTFVINGTNAGNSETFTRRAKLENKDGHGVTFKTHQKTRISGLMVPEGVKWTINYDQIVVTSWDSEVEKSLDMKEQFIDLGLPSGTKWSSINIGATAESGVQSYGDHYAWGELSTKATYTLANYRWSSYEKYNGTDHLNSLKLEDDIVHQQLGGRRHIPTREQFEELFNSTYTTAVWVDNYEGNGVGGYVVTSKSNSNSIFLPAAGLTNDTDGLVLRGIFGCYWSSTLNLTSDPVSFPYPSCAIDLDFSNSEFPFIYVENDDSRRMLGESIRPVEDPEPTASI